MKIVAHNGERSREEVLGHLIEAVLWCRLVGMKRTASELERVALRFAKKEALYVPAA